MMITEPKYEFQGNKEVCINSRDVIKNIRQNFPQETYKTLAYRADVHIQTIMRWVSVGRSEAGAMRCLLSSLGQEVNHDSVLLKNATPTQLRRQCQIIGWDNVINAPRTGELFMNFDEAREQIAEKMAMDADAWVSSLDDCIPGHYGVQDWDVTAYPENIWVDFPSMSFTFKDVDFDFEVRQGGSREDDSMDVSYNRKASGTGNFECSGGKISSVYGLEIEFDLDLTEDGECTRV